jgi:hypothetical protein
MATTQCTTTIMGKRGKRALQESIGTIPENKAQRKTRFIGTLVIGTSINVTNI